jgi:uncharacterized protein (TIGR03790 family)
VTRLICLIVLFCASLVRAELRADELVLIVNARQPAGRALAEHYAAVRGVPADRIVELDLPDQLAIDYPTYQRSVLAPVRAFLNQSDLRDRVRCAVLFMGVPLRIDASPPSPAEAAEIELINQLLRPAFVLMRRAVDELEQAVKSIDPSFAPRPGADSQGARQRVIAAQQAFERVLRSTADAATRSNIARRIGDVISPLAGSLTVEDQARARELMARPGDPESRKALRELLSRQAGPLVLAEMLESQKLFLSSDHSGASVDSELACMWWPADYSRREWQDNPLRGSTNDLAKPTVMTARLDGPSPEVVRRMIDNSLAVESVGLRGRAAVDARGIQPTPGNGFGAFDELLRQTASGIQSTAIIETVLDDKPEVFAAGSVQNIALYVGWYALRAYTSPGQFVPGSVAYHVASLELNWMRSEKDTGWCRALLLDGADATIGAVAEPYLHAFPPPDRFFAELLSGKSLGEAYWRTTPMVSWQMALLGDPLYRPFARAR